MASEFLRRRIHRIIQSNKEFRQERRYVRSHLCSILHHGSQFCNHVPNHYHWANQYTVLKRKMDLGKHFRDGFDSDMVMPATALANRMNAVLAIDGDYYNYKSEGFTLRQGELFENKLTGKRDVLYIDEDGDFHIQRLARKGSGRKEIDGKKVVNAFFFGPTLVENGELNDNFACDGMACGDPSQRMCIAQVGKLHYKVICCGAPERGSEGMTIRQFAKLVYSCGVQTAYNLDGGNSTMLIFNGEKLNDVDNPKARAWANRALLNFRLIPRSPKQFRYHLKHRLRTGCKYIQAIANPTPSARSARIAGMAPSSS